MADSSAQAEEHIEGSKEVFDEEAKLIEARNFMRVGSLDEAIELLSSVLEMKIAKLGENHLDCAPVYVEYAKALLTKFQAEGDPFGRGVCQKEDQEDSNEQEGDDDTQAAAGEDNEGEGEGEGEGAGGEEEDNDADDLELSFQCFEVARLIYEKATGHERELADVLECIGEVHMENEMWQDAITEFERSLSMKKQLLSPNDRQLAHLHYQIGTATVALMEACRREAMDSTGGEASSSDAKSEADYRRLARQAYEAAAQVLELKLESMRQSADGSDSSERSELDDVLSEVRAKVAEFAEETSVQPPSNRPASEGVTTIGFGPVAETGFGDSIGFGCNGSHVELKNLGVVGGSSGKKKALIEPVTGDPTECGAPNAEAMAPPARKRVRLDVSSCVTPSSE